MTLHATPVSSVPEETARIARAAVPTGNGYVQMRDGLGSLYIYTDEQFADRFAVRGRPVVPPPGSSRWSPSCNSPKGCPTAKPPQPSACASTGTRRSGWSWAIPASTTGCSASSVPGWCGDQLSSDCWTCYWRRTRGAGCSKPEGGSAPTLPRSGERGASCRDSSGGPRPCGPCSMPWPEKRPSGCRSVSRPHGLSATGDAARSSACPVVRHGGARGVCAAGGRGWGADGAWRLDQMAQPGTAAAHTPRAEGALLQELGQQEYTRRVQGGEATSGATPKPPLRPVSPWSRPMNRRRAVRPSGACTGRGTQST
jgi:hypothetical protein